VEIEQQGNDEREGNSGYGRGKVCAFPFREPTLPSVGCCMTFPTRICTVIQRVAGVHRALHLHWLFGLIVYYVGAAECDAAHSVAEQPAIA
jgi:hypothetical protein